MTNNSFPRLYDSRLKIDSKGVEHWHVFVPSARGGAWCELIDFPDDPEFRRQILDPLFLPEWKEMWLEDAYRVFRRRENARKRADVGFGSEDDVYGIEVSSATVSLDEIPATSGYAPSAEAIVEAVELEKDRARVVAQILLPLTDQQRYYVTLSLGDGHSYADIARMESPDADEHLIAKKADAIRKCVDRATKRILKISGSTRPVSGSGEDV